MNWGPLLIMLGFLILGMIYTNWIAKRMRAKGKEEKLTTQQLISELSVFDAACYLTFGPFVIMARKLFRKVKK